MYESARFRRLVTDATRGKRSIVERADLVQAAVLVPIVFREGQPRLLFTKRTMTVATHKGQISFPGGARESGDADAVATALREAQEEIGLDPALVEVVDLLDDYATVSGFVITPVVGFLDPDATFEVDPVEVAELFEVPVATLGAPGTYELKSWQDRGQRRDFHTYTVGEHVIWGATGAILRQFLTSIREQDMRLQREGRAAPEC